MSRKVGSELDEIRKNLKIDITSILLASKDGFSERELINEYYLARGKAIPFGLLGYASIFDLMKDSFMRDSVRIEKHRSGNTWIYFGIHNEATRALGDMIKHQMDNNKSRRETSRAYEKCYSEKVLRMRYAGGAQANSSGLSNNPKIIVPANVQKEIEEILRNEKDFTMNNEDFEIQYLYKTGFKLKPLQYGYESLRQLLESLTHLVQVKQETNYRFSIQLAVNNKENPIQSETEQKKIPTDENNNCADSTFKSTLNGTLHKVDNLNRTQNGVYLTFEEELIENLKQIIEIHAKKPIPLSTIIPLYKQHTQKSLDIEKLGYYEMTKFLYDKLNKFIKFIKGKEELMVLSMTAVVENNMTLSEDNLSESDNEHESKKFLKLKESVKKALLTSLNKPIPLATFYKLFENKFGYAFDFREYGFVSMDQLLVGLHKSGLIAFTIGPKFEQLITLLPERSETESDDEINERDDYHIGSDNQNYNKDELTIQDQKITTESLRNYTANFIQDYVLSDSDLEPSDIWKQFLKNQTISIIVSNIVDPCLFQIQLEKNKNDLEILMENLEKIYYGIGASYYNMPNEYITLGRLCAAVFPLDSNWHRCKIVGVDRTHKKVKVVYLDYGGEDLVPFEGIKFLEKQFATLPIQAVNAKLFNIKKPLKNIWHKDVLNYMLKIVKGKTLTAKIIGVNNASLNNLFSLEMYLTTTQDNNSCPKGTNISINTRLVQDGYGEFYDEASTKEFTDFETFRQEEFESEDFVESLNSSSNSNQNQAPVENNTVNDFSQNKPILLIDEQAEEQDEISSPIFRKPLKSLQNRTITFSKLQNLKVILFRIDEIIYLHWTQTADLIGLNHEDFWRSLNTMCEDHDEFIKKLKYRADNKELFHFVDKNLHRKDELIHFFVYEKLEKLIDLFFTPKLAHSKKYNLSLVKNKIQSARHS